MRSSTVRIAGPAFTNTGSGRLSMTFIAIPSGNYSIRFEASSQRVQHGLGHGGPPCVRLAGRESTTAAGRGGGRGVPTAWRGGCGHGWRRAWATTPPELGAHRRPLDIV